MANEMEDRLLQSRRDEAIAILCQFVAFLESHDLGGWSSYFYEMADALNRKDDLAAIAIEAAIPRCNMGSFGDFYVKGIGKESDRGAQREFDRLNGAVTTAITRVRRCIDYRLAHPSLDD